MTVHALVLEQWAGRRLVGVNGAPLSVSGCKKVDIFLKYFSDIFKVMCVVTDDIMVEAILGLDFVNAHNGIIDCGSKRLTFPSRNISVPLQMQSCPLLAAESHRTYCQRENCHSSSE